MYLGNFDQKVQSLSDKCAVQCVHCVHQIKNTRIFRISFFNLVLFCCPVKYFRYVSSFSRKLREAQSTIIILKNRFPMYIKNYASRVAQSLICLACNCHQATPNLGTARE